jgi:hypothetical protein
MGITSMGMVLVMGLQQGHVDSSCHHIAAVIDAFILSNDGLSTSQLLVGPMHSEEQLP